MVRVITTASTARAVSWWYSPSQCQVKIMFGTKCHWDLNNLVQLFNQCNASKSNYTHCSLCYVEYGPAIVLADTTLKEVYSSKCLGIHRGLTWNNHINSILSKLSSHIYTLRNLPQILPCLGTDDGLLRIDLPTSLQRSFIVSGHVQITSIGERLRLQKSSILAKINRESCLPAFKKLNLLTSPFLYILETAVFFKSNVPLLEVLIYKIIKLEAGLLSY